MKKFWQWYESHYKLNLGIALGLFSLQIVHLFWLLTHVIWTRLFGYALFNPSGVFETLIILVDYTEIPALISISIVYINELRKKFGIKPAWFLISLLLQLVHMFWITDEFVIGSFSGKQSMFPGWLAWIAIVIDYLELPVIWETLRLFVIEVKKGNLRSAAEVIKNKD